MPYNLRQFVLMAACVLFLTGCSRKEQDQPRQDVAITSARPHDSVIIELQGKDSVTVFDILQSSHQVDYFTTAAGVFVKAIDSLENNNDFFWIYSVNDTMPQVASDRYMTSGGDSIRWHYRRIEP